MPPTPFNLHHSHPIPPTLPQAAHPEVFSLVLLLCSWVSHLLLLGKCLDLFDSWYKAKFMSTFDGELTVSILTLITLGKFGSFPLYGK